ncbi:MAG: MFS transporter [Anaerolineales bacterium]|nr:MFS transporter [Anaerolineales bacterium]
MSLLKNRYLLAATFGHFSVDMYSGMLPLILLALTPQLGLTYSQVGIASMIYSLAGSLSQPFFGWLGDQRGARPMAVLGVAAIAMTVGIMRFVDSYAILIALAIVAGLGSGAFHPQGATLAAHAPNAQRGAAASVFMLGGNTGFAFGPIFNTAIFAMTGNYMPETLAALGLAQAAIVYWALAHQQSFRREKNAATPPTFKRAAISVIVVLMLVMFLRSWLHSSVSTYVPQMFKSFGYSNADAGNVLFSILLPLAIGGLIGGTLSDKIGRRRILIATTVLCGPLFWLLLQSSGAMVYVAGVLLGLTMGASTPVTLVMAQSLVPRGLGLMSGIVLGFTFIAGAIGVAISGVLADQIGLFQTLNVNAILPVLAAALALLLPDDKPGSAQRA